MSHFKAEQQPGLDMIWKGQPKAADKNFSIDFVFDQTTAICQWNVKHLK